jgi:hypothetical protein
VALIVACAYPLAGVAFAAFAGLASSPRALVAWRLAAWLVSGAAFLAHIAYEHSRLRLPPRRIAGHVGGAVALGAFLLAVWVLAHGHWAAPGRQSPLAPLALVLFPLVTGVPGFLAAFVIAAILARLRSRRGGPSTGTPEE